MTYVLAVDIGQVKDYTALVVLRSYSSEPADANMRTRAEKRHDLVHAERFREVSYPEQVQRIEERYAHLRQVAKDENADVAVVVDATGVGLPILDSLRAANIPAEGVLITGGDATSRSGSVTRVPKRELVATLQIALQSGRLRIAKDLALANVLVNELQGFRAKITLSGHAKFGNDVGDWREADHDDLVLAASLAAWKVEQRHEVRATIF